MENNTATLRQRWQLYCLTKQCYDNIVISKSDADKLIKQFIDPNYSNKSMKNELLNYIKEHIDELYDACIEEIKNKSSIIDNNKTYAFVGNGCGITYLKYRKSKRAEELDCAAGDIRNNEVQNILISMLPRADYSYLKSIGCPFESIWCQMQKLQNKYYMLVVNFAKTKNIKMQIVSYID